MRKIIVPCAMFIILTIGVMSGCKTNEPTPLPTPTIAITATVAPVEDETPTPTDKILPTEVVTSTERITPTEVVLPTPEPSPVPTATPEPTSAPVPSVAPTATPVIEVSKDAIILKTVKIGDNVWYDFYDDGTLVVRGAGKTRSVDCKFEKGIPAYRDSEYIDNCKTQSAETKTVIISEGITGIGDWAISGFRNVEKISLPKSLTSIGY